ncbi:MAG: MutH/Sau3AI family endonuclease [Lachnospiraceae bacterium]|nr:MutH/Sau3AI family endonuclease [Lachnospiraceae bacterium]
MDDNHYFRKQELITILNSIVDKTLGEVDKNNVFQKTVDKPKITGIAGDVIEQSVLGYSADQAQRPDIDIDGIPTELKTTGMRLKKDGNSFVYEAKEPASITAVSINTIVEEEFYSSNFWHKIAHMLFIFYHYDSIKAVQASAYANFHIRGYSFFEFSLDDISILRRDWQIVHDFIADIKSRCSEEEAKKEYPNLSTIINKQITYLDTAPKYPHPPRFRLRKRVMTVIIQQSFNGNSFEKLPDHYFTQSDIEKKCAELMKRFLGWSMADILEHFGMVVDRTKNTSIKQYAEQVIVRMFGGNAKKISKVEMFRKFGYVGKAITITKNETRTEDTKLFSVDFDELSELTTDDEEDGVRAKVFEDSDLFNYFHDNKLLCVVFQENSVDKDGKVRLDDNMFLGFKILDLSDDELIEQARNTWNDARRIINNGELKFVPTLDKNGNQRISPKTKIIMGAPNLPKCESHIVFFRGTGQDATDKITVAGIEMLRQNYWIKGTYIVDKLKSIPFIGYELLSNSHKSKKALKNVHEFTENK